MTKNTPALNSNDKKDYIQEHLFNELRWLLCAATEWSIQDKLNLSDVGYDVQVYSMDSAFLHARTLFEFFLKCTSSNYYGADQFLSGPLTSNLYTNDWCVPLHSFLMHAQDRSNPRQLNTASGLKDLNQMPVEFAYEILRLWEEFEKQLSNQGHCDLYALAYKKRQEAINCARCVPNSHQALRHARGKNVTLNHIF